jgi:hypothetical protein
VDWEGVVRAGPWAPWFDNLILLAIMANAVILCQMEPLKLEGRGCTGLPPSSPGGNAVIESTELLFTIVFTTECFIKVVAKGFLLDDTSYLKDGWNVLDFMVVAVSLLSNIPGMGSNVSALRVIRVLRPLRTLSILPGMRVLIGTMIKSVPMIANVLLFCVFFFTIFGIFGLQVFMGVLRNRCFTVVPDSTCAEHAGAAAAVFCREVVPSFSLGPGVNYGYNLTAAVLLETDAEQTCTNTSLNWPGHTCGVGQMCLKANNPNRGITHFDNIWYAWLTIFQCITLEGWTPIMYMCMDAVTGWSVVYFILVVFTGGGAGVVTRGSHGGWCTSYCWWSRWVVTRGGRQKTETNRKDAYVRTPAKQIRTHAHKSCRSILHSTRKGKI